MNSWTANKIAAQRTNRNDVKGGKSWRRLEIHQDDAKPSWRVYGRGVASARINAVINRDGVAIIELQCSETAFADSAKGRDTTKETSFNLYGSAAIELFEMLREAFEAGPMPTSA